MLIPPRRRLSVRMSDGCRLTSSSFSSSSSSSLFSGFRREEEEEEEDEDEDESDQRNESNQVLASSKLGSLQPVWSALGIGSIS